MKPLTIKIDEFCRVIGCGRTKCFQLINQGSLETIKLGRRTLITMASVEALIERSRVERD